MLCACDAALKSIDIDGASVCLYSCVDENVVILRSHRNVTERRCCCGFDVDAAASTHRNVTERRCCCGIDVDAAASTHEDIITG